MANDIQEACTRLEIQKHHPVLIQNLLLAGPIGGTF